MEADEKPMTVANRLKCDGKEVVKSPSRSNEDKVIVDEESNSVPTGKGMQSALW